MATPSSVDYAEAMSLAPVGPADWLIVAAPAALLFGGALSMILARSSRAQPAVAIATLAFATVTSLLLLHRTLVEGPLTMVMGSWLPPFGIAFTVDTLGGTLAFTSALIGLCAAVHGLQDVDDQERRYGFYPFLQFLLAGVIAAFLTGDLFNLYVWFEVLLISSFGLLVLGNRPAQLDGALKYGILNLLATTIFLVAIGLIYGLTGTLNMADIAAKMQDMEVGGTVLTVAALFFLAFAAKAAAFPVNFWLPASYHTPRIVVSAVFAGLLTKVGIYALLRIFLMIMPASRDIMADVMATVAILTMITGVAGALVQTDLRRMLGFLVISGIVAMLTGLAVGTEAAAAGAIFYAVHSIIVMTALFMAAGLMCTVAGTYDIRVLGGLYGAHPALAGIFLVLALAVSGLPPFSGFWPKVMLVEASLGAGRPWLAGAILVSGFLTTIAVGRVWLYAFWRGGPEGTPDGVAIAVEVRQAGGAAISAGTGATLWIPLLVLAALVVVIGLLPQTMFELTQRGAADLVDPWPYIRSVFGGTS